MSFWFWHGLTAGIHTTRYPRKPDTIAGISPGRPADTRFHSEADAELAAAICPVEAIEARGKSARVDHGKCIHCRRCRFGLEAPMNWEAATRT